MGCPRLLFSAFPAFFLSAASSFFSFSACFCCRFALSTFSFSSFSFTFCVSLSCVCKKIRLVAGYVVSEPFHIQIPNLRLFIRTQRVVYFGIAILPGAQGRSCTLNIQRYPTVTSSPLAQLGTCLASPGYPFGVLSAEPQCEGNLLNLFHGFHEPCPRELTLLHALIPCPRPGSTLSLMVRRSRRVQTII